MAPTIRELEKLHTGIEESITVNLAGILKRLEAAEARVETIAPARTVVRRIWQDGKLVGGYAGEITPDMFAWGNRSPA